MKNKFIFKKGGINKDLMSCNKPRRTPDHPTKKFVVKACDNGQEKIVMFGDANMTIKKNIPERRKSFRARHNCDNPGSKLSARYWSCKKWKTGGVFMFKNTFKQFKHGGIITGGVLHSERNEIGDKGIPVVPIDNYMKNGGKYDKNAKLAELENFELVYTKESAEIIDQLVDKYNDCKCPGVLVELGKYIKKILPEIKDYGCKINGYCQLRKK